MEKPTTVANAKQRPYWHVDAKWICGLLLLWVLGITLFIFSGWRLTERGRAIELGTLMVATAFSPGGLDEAGDIEQLKQQELADPDDIVKPLPNLPVTISESSLEGASPRELRLSIFRQIVEPFYDHSLEELAQQYLPGNPEGQSEFINDAGLLRIMSAQTHQLLRNLLNYLVPIALLLLAGLIYFSHRFGKLVSPALVGLLVSLPPLALVSAVQMAQRTDNLPPAPADGEGPQLGSIMNEISPLLFDPLKQAYSIVALIAAGLLLAAIIGKIIYHFAHRKK